MTSTAITAQALYTHARMKHFLHFHAPHALCALCTCKPRTRLSLLHDCTLGFLCSFVSLFFFHFTFVCVWNTSPVFPTRRRWSHCKNIPDRRAKSYQFKLRGTLFWWLALMLVSYIGLVLELLLPVI